MFLFLSFPFCPSPFRLPAPSVPSAKEFSAIHHVQRKLYLAAAAEPLRMHSCIENTPEDRFPSSSAPRGPYPSSLLLSADTWSRMLKIGTFLTDPGVVVVPFTLTPYSELLYTTHTHTPPKFASAFNSHDISLTQMTHQLQITKSRKGLCFFLCPQGFNPKCVFFFLSSFPTEPKLKEIPPQKNKSPQPFSTNWLFAKLMLIDIGISIEHNHNRAQTIGIQALFLQCLPSYLSQIFSFTWFQEVYNFFFFLI